MINTNEMKTPEPLTRLDAYDEGADAAEAGLLTTENPYKPDTVNHAAWNFGYRDRDKALDQVDADMLGEDE